MELCLEGVFHFETMHKGSIVHLSKHVAVEGGTERFPRSSGLNYSHSCGRSARHGKARTLWHDHQDLNKEDTRQVHIFPRLPFQAGRGSLSRSRVDWPPLCTKVLEELQRKTSSYGSILLNASYTQST
ncbi:uncharacterized protein [Dermacentor albipictus]|uniref:uncharacterized protein isoform X6 n=1 Tax=Dermacentor albipictus TaxID=60249 RepID=UPI0038FC0E0E